jgi:LysR family transcriptional regulator, transcriptional activator of the cysJI operon
MDFEQIRAFINVALLRSFSEAAEKMFISQPSVSVRVKALEDELGVILFDRSKAREPHLTEAGKTFLDYAQAMINLNDECREKISGQREESAGLVYIGASTVPGIYLLPDLLVGFRQQYYSIDFNVNILDTAAVLENVLNYSYDLGFVGLIKQDDRLKYLALAEDELVYCTAKDKFPCGKYNSGVQLDYIFNFHLIMREKGSATRQLLENKLTTGGYSLSQFQGITYINSLEGIKQAVRSGLGGAVLSKLAASDLVKTGEMDVYPIEGIDLKRSLYLVYHHSRILAGAAEIFRDYITHSQNYRS